jgi:hypothetical protein
VNEKYLGDCMKTIFSLIMILSVNAFAKEPVGLIYANEETQQACIVQNHESLAQLGLSMCAEGDRQTALELSALEENPKVAGAAGIIAEAIVGYWAVCSMIQYSPEMVGYFVEKSDERTSLEKIKDIFSPSEETQIRNQILNETQDFSKMMMGSFCRVAGAANEYLIKLFEGN